MERIFILGITTVIIVICTRFVVVGESPSQVISYTRMYADDSGRTHFSDETITLEDDPDVPDFMLTPFAQASSVGFYHAAATLDMDWHPAPRRQWLFVLTGTLEVEVQDGEVRQFPVGSIIFVEDTEGKGHKTRVVGKVAFVAAVVPVGTK